MVMDMKVTVICTLNCTIMMENKPHILTVSIHTMTTENGAVKISIPQGSIPGCHAFPHIQPSLYR